MYKLLPLFLLSIFLSTAAEAQFSRHIIRFKDKGSNPFTLSNPSQYLTQRAISRRTRYNIPVDSTDLPVTPRYIDSLRLAGNVSILNTSKWLNQVLIRTTDAAALAKINAMPFVLSSSPIAPRLQNTSMGVDKLGKTDNIEGNNEPSPENLTDYYNYGRSNGQVKIHQGDFLHNHGFRGEGMHLAMLDAGFFNYLTLRPFDSIRQNNQILGTWDFVANEPSVNEDNSHGMLCLSTIAANVPGVFVGTSPKTSFYLYRTEDVASEYPVEEQNLAAGLERSDSVGVDLCSISLGYTEFDDPIFNYTYANLNGNTTISARASDLAAKKGMLIVVANGNEGTKPWRFLVSPADGDSVMAVGAVDTLGNVAAFSSYGPSSDGQIKPNVSAVGLNAVVASASTGAPVYGNGTSFASPNMAGITSCLWQAFPEVNNMGIIDALQQSASKASAPDNRVGYGIPDAKKAFVHLIKKMYSQQATLNNCIGVLQVGIKADSSMSVILERKLGSEINYSVVSTKVPSGSFKLQNITFNDDLSLASAGQVKYRVSLSIAADTTFFLDSLSLTSVSICSGGVTSNYISIGPNPVFVDLNVIVTRITDAKYDIIVHTVRGQNVHKLSGSQPAGRGNISIPMSHLSSGVYYVTVYIDSKKTITKKVLKR